MDWKNTKKYPYGFDLMPNSALAEAHQHEQLMNQRELAYQAFIARYGFDKYSYNIYPKRFKKFIEGNRSYNQGKFWDTNDGYRFMDHVLVFKRSGVKGNVLVSHPYQLRADDLMELKGLVKRFGLDYKIWDTAESFYWPNSTLMLAIMPKGYLEAL